MTSSWIIALQYTDLGITIISKSAKRLSVNGYKGFFDNYVRDWAYKSFYLLAVVKGHSFYAIVRCD